MHQKKKVTCSHVEIEMNVITHIIIVFSFSSIVIFYLNV